MRLFVCLLVLGAGCAEAASTFVFEKDQVYATVDGQELYYDIAQPAKGAGPFPFVLCVHAGAWQVGTKKTYRDICKELAEKGYVAATIDYRFAPEHKWPAQLEDVQRAIRYFRANAASFKIDPKRFGATGDDAGAHLILMDALKAAKDEANVPVEKSTKLQAVVNYFAPLDLRGWKVTDPWLETKIRIGLFKGSEQVIADFVGTTDRSAPIFEEVSPLMHVTSGAPAILTFLGDQDPIIPVSDGKKFHEALKAAGNVEKLVIVEGQDHNRENINFDGKAFEQMYAWFDKYLKGGAQK